MSEDLLKEQQHVDFVVDVIEQKAKQLGMSAMDLREEVVESRKTFWEDVTVNLDEPDDVHETQASLKQRSELLAERERSHKQVYEQLKILDRLKYSPYFGRIDFHEDGESSTDVIYLGIASLMDLKEENFIIYDWRAPISSLYYDYAPGPARYLTPGGEITGTMEAKKQFIIRNSKIKAMFDTGVTIGDEMLQEVLGNQANVQMKTIVATIQKEQNQIIRNETSRYLIVQGAAGSGKTSAALQRVAFLLYRYRGKLTSENIMLFSPNPMFNSYISTVLPELGEENVQQTTFQHYAEERIGRQFTLEKPFAQLEHLLTAEEAEGLAARKQGIALKAGLAFKNFIESYVKVLSHKGLMFKNISFRGNVLIHANEIRDYFYSLDSSISIKNRITLVSEWMIGLLKMAEKRERQEEWVEQEIELMEKEEYLKVYQELQAKGHFSENSFDDYEREQKLLAKVIVNRYFKRAYKQVKRLEYIDVKAIYSQLFTDFASPAVKMEKWEAICEQTKEQLAQNRLFYEDITPYLYLEDKLKGGKAHSGIRQLFIDEAQDYSPFQLEYFKEIFPYARMTILGDINQAIFAQTTETPTLLSKDLFEAEKAELIVLTKSYRSTRQIIEFTKPLIPGGELIEPFNRSGEKPVCTIVGSDEDLSARISDTVANLQAEGHETIAIICKTARESSEAFEKLKDSLPVKHINRENQSFEKGILVIPVYLAKGIEFDGVVLYDAASYERESDRRLFYTACTRAMHKLEIFTTRERSFFMDLAEKDTYTLIKA